MRSPGACGPAPRRRAGRPPARAGRAPAPRVDGPPPALLHRRWRSSSSGRYGWRMAARLVGINHVALEVGDIDEALEWYGRFFELELRGRHGSSMAFVDMGDQFIALARVEAQ